MTNRVMVGLAFAGLFAVPKPSIAQGCEPIRFSNPSLGAQGESYQEAHQWRLTIGLRHLYSNQIFVGTDVNNAAGPGGTPPVINLNTFAASLSYSMTDRFSLELAIPFATGSMTRLWPDTASHRESGTGIGDVSLLGNMWLLDPGTHRRGNIAFGLGVKVPTSNNHVASQFYSANNAPVPFDAN